ncbi:MAG TPA: DUF3566 domain-containing protein [Streptosporangiaceae bacterium]|nr:DUF3566 domain-containing protein [Streptosporangiaceae bacterium]
MEQRADETARLPRVAAGDAGLPSMEGRQADATAAASEDAGEASGYSAERTSLSWNIEGSYASPAVEDGYGPPGTQRDYPAPPSSDREYPAPTAESVYGSAAASRDYAASPYSAQVSPPPSGPEPDQAQRMKEYEAERATEWQPPRQQPWPQVVPRVPKAARTPRRAGKSGEAPRQAHLTVARLEPGSVMKFSFVISLVCFVILFVAVALLYGTLSGLGVFSSIQGALSNVTSSQGSTGVNVSHWFSASTILGYTALLGLLDVVLITALTTVGAVIYNLVSQLVGGIEVTLRETE